MKKTTTTFAQRMVDRIAERILQRIDGSISAESICRQEPSDWIEGDLVFDNGDWARTEFYVGDTYFYALIDRGDWEVDIHNEVNNRYYYNIIDAVEKRLKPYYDAARIAGRKPLVAA